MKIVTAIGGLEPVAKLRKRKHEDEAGEEEPAELKKDKDATRRQRKPRRHIDEFV